MGEAGFTGAVLAVGAHGALLLQLLRESRLAPFRVIGLSGQRLSLWIIPLGESYVLTLVLEKRTWSAALHDALLKAVRALRAEAAIGMTLLAVIVSLVFAAGLLVLLQRFAPLLDHFQQCQECDNDLQTRRGPFQQSAKANSPSAARFSLNEVYLARQGD